MKEESVAIKNWRRRAKKNQKTCPKHKIAMRPVSHKDHTDWQCSKCWNILCPELSPKRTLRAARIPISKNWHGDEEIAKLMEEEGVRC